MTYLLDHPPVRDQFRRTRREAESGVVVIHTAESTPDTVATDGGAEAVANFIRTRTTPGSYHTLADSDSRLPLIPWDMEAYQDGTGSNRHAVGLSVATRADWWPWAPQAWRDGAVEQLAQAAAEYARWLHARRGIVIPPRRITRAESEARQPGFISHGERDPARRTDPGADFPWDRFLHRYADLTADLQAGEPTSEEDPFMALTDKQQDDLHRWMQETTELVRQLAPFPPERISRSGEIVPRGTDGSVVAQPWVRWVIETTRKARALENLDVPALAEALASRLPATSGPVKITDLEEALRNVLGSLDEDAASAG